MPRLAANLSMLYPEHPCLDRFASAAADGFAGVECLFPYEHPLAEMAARLRQHGLQQVLLNAPPGDVARGERGLAGLPGREREFRDSVATALRWAEALGCPRIHVMSGVVPAGASREALRALWAVNLRQAARTAAALGIEVLVEPLNPRDVPGYLIDRQDQAHAWVEAVGEPNLKVQMDLYHCQVVEGDVATKIRRWLPTGRVGHLQIAGVPQRHEPDVGEMDGVYLLGVVDEVSAACGWTGWVGCEYRPARGAEPGGTRAGLGWRDRLAGAWR